jgi:hypothetical protein
VHRKKFIKNTSLVVASFSLPGYNTVFAGSLSEKKVRVGMIGVGNRGQSHLGLLVKRDDVDVIAICDIDKHMLDKSINIINRNGKKAPVIYTGDIYSWKKLLERKDIDAVIISTPWEWHTEMIIGSIQAGIKYIGTEVVLGITLQDHWDVVNEWEKSDSQVMMLENVCYRRDVMAVLNMVRLEIFGELIHLQGGYQHDLQGVKFNNGEDPPGRGVEFGEKAFSEARWRTIHSINRNGDLYPTHGIGPIAHFININRGNRFTHLSSFSTKSRGLHSYIVKHGGKDHPNAKIHFKLGDIVTTSINCANGETVLLQHDTNLPRPYSLGFRVQGTKGLWMDINQGIYIEDKSKPDLWDDQKEWFQKYDHPLWKRLEKNAEGAGHGGMDYFVINSFIESAKRQIPTPMDVYDAATWSVITPLSEHSIDLGNQVVEFPDFTRGKWMYRKPVFALNDDY